MKNPFRKRVEPNIITKKKNEIITKKKNELVIFSEQLEIELEKLSNEEIIRFSWRCVVRALPFLGIEKNFDFWKSEEKQKFLYSIFRLIDLVIYPKDSINSNIFNTGYSLKATPMDVTLAAKYAAEAAFGFKKSSFISVEYIYIVKAKEAINGARNAAVASRTAGVDYLKFQHILLKDLKENKNSVSELYNLKLYGKTWNNFYSALEVNGCGYWAKWYQKIFNKGLVLDKEDEEEIKMRLSVPGEITVQGAAAVARYMLELEQGTEKLNEARILILGDKGAGKTCLSRRLKDPNAVMTTDEESTPGVDTTLWKLEKENVNVHIWDFAGHTVTHAVHQFFLSERCLYIIVYDGRTEGRNRLEYWLDHMKNYGENSKAIILVNKRDAHAVEVPINRLKEQYPILDVCTFSIRDDKDALEKFRQEVVNYINTNPSWSTLLIPESSYKVKKELEKLFKNGDKNGKELIERKVFDAIAEKYKVKDSESLLSDLHALGISLWYKDMEKYNTMVLNPEWISNGVYRIINWANNQRKHCLPLVEFYQVFEKDFVRYPESQHRFLFELMKKYELAYEAKEKDVLIIPRLLHEDQPKEMPQFSIGESLMARYKADQPLMSDTISRFIVRHNQEIKKEAKNYLVWRSGVILEKNKGTIALVREEDDRTITVSVKGTYKTENTNTTRETPNGNFES